MEIQALVESVQDLSDLELATLLCLIAKQHCCIEAEDELVDDLAQELALVCSVGFYLWRLTVDRSCRRFSVFHMSYFQRTSRDPSKILETVSWITTPNLPAISTIR